MALSSSSLHGRTGEEPSGAGGGPIRALCASAVARGRGERRRGPCGVDSRSLPGPGRPEMARPLRPAAAAVTARSGHSRGAAAVKRGGGAPVGLRGAQAYLDSGRGAVERGLRGGRRSGAAAMANGGARMSGRRLRSSGLGMWCGGAAPGPFIGARGGGDSAGRGRRPATELMVVGLAWL